MTQTEVKASDKTKAIAYDVAEQLRTPEDVAAYLDAWFDEAPGDAAGIARAVGDVARAKACPKWQKMSACPLYQSI